MPFLTANHINKSYHVGTQRLHVLRDLDLAVEQGEMVAVVGASGVGKSTLLHLLGGLDRADSGSIIVGDTDLGAMPDDALTAFRNKHVGFVFQFHHLLPEFTALENAEMPLRIARMQPGRVETAGRSRYSNGLDLAIGLRTGPACCRAANSSALRWPVRW